MANIWKPNPSIAAYYDRVEATATGGRCQHCQMVSHIFRDVAYSEPFRPLVVWQHTSACPVPALRTIERLAKEYHVRHSPKDR